MNIVNLTRHLAIDSYTTTTTTTTAAAATYQNYYVNQSFHDRYSTWTDIFHRHNPTALYIDRTVTPIWYIIGILGNIMSALVWSERRTRRVNSSAIYLTTLAITDTLVLALHSLVELEFAWGVPLLGHVVICELYFVFSFTFQYSSPLLVLVFTVERWIAVCWPFKKEKYCSERRAKRVVVVCICSIFAICLMQSYFWLPHDGRCMLRVGSDRFYLIWTWCMEMAVFLCIPCVNLAFNVLVIKEMCRISKRTTTDLHSEKTKMNESRKSVQRSEKRREAHARVVTTCTLLCVSFYVIVSTLPATLVYLIRLKQGDPLMSDAQMDKDPVWIKYFRSLTIRKVIEEACMSHYACNFFLYAITGSHFRTRAWQVLIGKRNDREAERRLSTGYSRYDRKSVCLKTTPLVENSL